MAGLGDVQIRGLYNRRYGQVLTLTLLSNLRDTPLLFHNIFFGFKHTFLNAPRHAMWINAGKTQTHSTPGAAVLLALFHTVKNLKIKHSCPIISGHYLYSRTNPAARVRQPECSQHMTLQTQGYETFPDSLCLKMFICMQSLSELRISDQSSKAGHGCFQAFQPFHQRSGKQ